MISPVSRRFLRPSLFCSALALSFASIGCGGGSGTTATTPDPADAGGRIAFASNRDGNYEIYSMRPDGSDVKRITNSPGVDTQPSWSYDRRQIAFASNRDGVGKPAIYVANADGSGARRVTPTSECAQEPSFGPDGRIVYRSGCPLFAPAFETQLRIVPSTGVGTSQLLVNKVEGFSSYQPQWGANNLIVFSAGDSDLTPGADDLYNLPSGRVARAAREPDRTSFICTVRPDGSQATRLFPDRRKDGQPTFLPDGRKILFLVIQGPLDTPSYMSNSDGSNLTPLADREDGSPFYGRYSPDGQRLVNYVGAGSPGDRTSEIAVFDADGRNIKRLTNNSFDDAAADWK